MEIIVTEVGAGIVYYPELHKWAVDCDCNPDDKNFEALSMLDSDPDIIKCEDCEKLYFITIEREGKKFVLTSDETTPEQNKMLTDFHTENWNENYSATESTWANFNALTNSIAYRGGKGYNYTIWDYTPKTQN